MRFGNSLVKFEVFVGFGKGLVGFGKGLVGFGKSLVRFDKSVVATHD